MKKGILFFYLLLHLVVDLSAQTGPGGVGTTTGSSSLKAWYRVDYGASPWVPGSLLSSWTNSAGISALNLTESGTNRPTVATGPNNFNEISFSGTNRLVTAIGAITTTNFVNSQASTFVVCRADNTTQTSCVYTTDPLENTPGTRFSNHIPWSGTVYYDIGTCCADRIQVGGLSGLTNYNIWTYEAINTTAGKQLYQNGTQVFTDAVAALTYSNHATQRFNLGGFTSNGEAAGFQGDITEVIVYTTKVNTAQRYIIQNYLSAKYDIALTANDLYTRDDVANGNFDYDVAGIGRIDATNIQTDSRGTGVVRVLNTAGLADGEYLFWGHNNGALKSQATDKPGTVAGRWTRIWAAQEIGNVTDIDIEFDLSLAGSVTAGHLRLLVDTDLTFANATVCDETAVETPGGSKIYRFTDVEEVVAGAGNTFRYFTLATTDITSTPLPITLLSFDAKVDHNNDVKITWSTAQEINNDFFTIERSSDGLMWEEIKTVPGSGDSKVVIDYVEFDHNPIWGKSYYRLKQTDFDRTSTHSKVVSVLVSKTFKDILVYPIPANDELLVEYPSSERIILKLTDEMGRERGVTPVQDKRGASLPTSTLPPGIYFLYISNGRESTYKKIVIE